MKRLRGVEGWVFALSFAGSYWCLWSHAAPLVRGCSSFTGLGLIFFTVLISTFVGYTFVRIYRNLRGTGRDAGP